MKIEKMIIEASYDSDSSLYISRDEKDGRLVISSADDANTDFLFSIMDSVIADVNECAKQDVEKDFDFVVAKIRVDGKPVLRVELCKDGFEEAEKAEI